MNYRVRNIVIAVALAVVAAAIVMVYVSSARRSEKAAGKPVTVFVASRDVMPGTAGTSVLQGGWLRAATVARSAMVPGAITNLSQLAGLVAIQSTYTGEQVTSRRFGQAQEQGVRSDLHGALRIVQLPGDQNQLLAGTLKDGDHVDVVASIKVPEDGQIHFSRVVLRDLLIVQPADKPSAGSAIRRARCPRRPRCT